MTTQLAAVAVEAAEVAEVSVVPAGTTSTAGAPTTQTILIVRSIAGGITVGSSNTSKVMKAVVRNIGGYAMSKKLNSSILICLIALLCGASSFTPAQQLRSTLQDRARRSGGKLVWRYRATRSLIYPNVDELAKRSDVIVVGRTLGHRPSLTPNGKFTTNDFLVKVQEVIKGDVSNRRSIVVSLPGGAHRFSDGAYAALLPANFKQAEDGGTYIFFLKKRKNNSVFKGHMLVSETQGLFELKDGRVEPADSVRSDPVVVKYRGMGAVNFLAQIHMAAPRRN